MTSDPRPGDPGYREIKALIEQQDRQRVRRHEQIMARFEQAQVLIDRTLAEERARAVAEVVADPPDDPPAEPVGDPAGDQVPLLRPTTWTSWPRPVPWAHLLTWNGGVSTPARIAGSSHNR